MPTDSSHSQPDHTSESQAPSESAPQSNSASREQQDKWFWEHTLYEELRKLAAARMIQERPDHTLQATALVHEAYVRLVDQDQPQHWDGRGHFYAAAAAAMRRILVEAARAKGRQKRGGDAMRADGMDLGEIAETTLSLPADQLLDVDEALGRLEQDEPELARLVNLRLYAGLSNREAAKVLGMPRTTADKRWRFALAWFTVELNR